MEKISESQFEYLFNEYLKDHKNPADGYMSRYGWYLNEKRKFKKQLEEKNITVIGNDQSQ